MSAEPYYRERHHTAQPQNMAQPTVFVSMEYDADHPPRVIEIEGTRWVRIDDVRQWEPPPLGEDS